MLGILVLRYAHCAGHTGAKVCTLCWAYWCLGMHTVLGILVLRYAHCAGHTGAKVCTLCWAYWC